jgi:hypothetical protein
LIVDSGEWRVESVANDLQVFPLKIRLRHYQLSILNYYLALIRALRCGWTLPHPVGAGDSVKNPNPPIGANIKNNYSTDRLPNKLKIGSLEKMIHLRYY